MRELVKYVATIRPAETGGYWIIFPDLPGCDAVSLAEAEIIAAAQEALWLDLKARLTTGEPLPEPTPREEILADPEHEDALDAVEIEVLINLEPPEEISTTEAQRAQGE